MDNAERIRRDFETLQELMPGYVFTLLELLMLRQLQGDGVDREQEARLPGRHADGKRDRAPFDAALPLGKRPAPQAVSHE